MNLETEKKRRKTEESLKHQLYLAIPPEKGSEIRDRPMLLVDHGISCVKEHQAHALWKQQILKPGRDIFLDSLSPKRRLLDP